MAAFKFLACFVFRAVAPFYLLRLRRTWREKRWLAPCLIAATLPYANVQHAITVSHSHFSMPALHVQHPCAALLKFLGHPFLCRGLFQNLW